MGEAGDSHGEDLLATGTITWLDGHVTGSDSSGTLNEKSACHPAADATDVQLNVRQSCSEATTDHAEVSQDGV